jgi:threonine aldolase
MIVAGSSEFVERARKCRQMLGGAMRQAGIVAAPGLVALDTMIDRLHQDHDNAKRLAEGLVELGIKIDMERVQTNIVLMDLKQLRTTAPEFVSQIEKEGIKASNFGRTTARMVTHRGIEKEDIEYALDAVSRALLCIRKKTEKAST